VQLLPHSTQPAAAAAAPAEGQLLTLPVQFQQQQDFSVNGSQSLLAANVRVVDTRDMWRDPNNKLLLAQAGAGSQVRGETVCVGSREISAPFFTQLLSRGTGFLLCLL
jgi:hypothetical protein